jgi:hypothetical protein
MDPLNARTDEVGGQRHEDKQYTTPQLRELGSLREATLGEISGNMEDSTMKKKTVV